MAARRASAQFLGILQRSSVRSFQPVVVPRRAAVATFSQGRDVNEHVARSTYGGFFGNRQLHKESQAKNDNEETHQYERTKMTDEGGGSVESDYGVKAAEVSQRGEKVAQEAKDKASEVTEQAKDKASETKDKASEVAEQAKDKASETKDKASEATEQAKGKASEIVSDGSAKVDEAKETVKEKTSEVADKASEVAEDGKGQVSKNVDTAKDMFKDLPQKVSETATGLKEVGVEAGKAVKRDASKLVQKVGLKSDEE